MVEFKNGKLYQGDCIEQLDNIADKSQQAIIIDPPYNIQKDYWDIIPDYYNWMEEVFIALAPKLRDNGTFVFFHNDFRMMAELDRRMESTDLIQRDFIVWNKRFDGSPRKGFLDGYVVKNNAHGFEKMAEYMLTYTKDNSWKLKEARERLGVKQTTISREILSKTGGMTGWYSNLETGKNHPTRETIIPIEKHLGLSYEDLVPKFNTQKRQHSIWNYDIERKQGHITPKPTQLLEELLLHYTDEGDQVLDCFAGSGSLGVSANNLNRKFTLIERDEAYCEIIKKQLSINKLF